MTDASAPDQTRPAQDRAATDALAPRRVAPDRVAPDRVAPEAEDFAHVLRRLAVRRAAERATKPGLYR